MRFHLSAWVGVVGLVLVGACGPDLRPAREDNKARIRVIVIDQGGDPVPEATVSLEPWELRGTTDANGEYRFRPIAISKQDACIWAQLDVTADGYGRLTWRNLLVNRDSSAQHQITLTGERKVRTDVKAGETCVDAPST